MASSFIAYIDESGDDGFVFNPDGTGSSKWLVLSALVVRKENDLELVQVARQARAVLGRDPNFALHFVKIKHEQRVPVCSLISTAKVRAISVLAHKYSLPDHASYQANKNLLYHYLTRILAERISWLCRDMRKRGKGDGTVELVFSNRAAMSYEQLRSYFATLESKSKELDVKIDWTVVRPQNVRSEVHDKRAGLQLADFVASGTRFAAELTKYGHAEPAYIKKLTRILYRRKGQLFSYGLKFYPDYDKVRPANPHLEEFAGLKKV